MSQKEKTVIRQNMLEIKMKTSRILFLALLPLSAGWKTDSHITQTSLQVEVISINQRISRKLSGQLFKDFVMTWNTADKIPQNSPSWKNACHIR